MQNLPNSQKKSRVKKKTGKVIMTTMVVSSLILSSVGFVYAFYLDFSLSNSVNQKTPLKINSDYISENDFLITNKINPNIDIEVQKKEFSSQIEELSEELLETKNRLIQLKRDILIRGGKKESDYLEKISKLEESLNHADIKSSENKKIILLKDEEIAKLQHELKEIETFYVEKSEKIQEELLATIEKHEKKLKKAEILLSQINQELQSKSQYASNNLSQLISQIQNFIDKSEFNKSTIIKDGDLEIEGFKLGPLNFNETVAVNDDNFNIPQRKLNIEQRIDRTQNKIDELESDYADDYFQKRDRVEEEILPKPYDNKKPSDLYDSIFQLKNELHESEERLKVLQNEYDNLENEKENEIIELRHEIERLKKSNIESSSKENLNNDNNYQIEINQLRTELSKAYKTLDSVKNGEITFDKNYYENRIKFLEEAIDIQKEALLSAQEEVLRISEEEMDSQLEAYYQSQIENLTHKNFELQNQIKLFNDNFSEMAATHSTTPISKNHTENNELAFTNHSSSTFGKVIANLKTALNIANEKKEAAENEVRLLREELLNSTSENEVINKKIEELEEVIFSLKKYNEIIKDELLAHEAANDLDENKILSQPLDSNLLRKLHAKITYLSTRLNQEKLKNDRAEAKIEEMKITLDEAKNRNQELEYLIHED